MPVLFSSGYAAGTIPGDFDGGHSPALVPKPYTPETLLRAVAEAMQRG